MDDRLKQQLARLGVTKGFKPLAPAPVPEGSLPPNWGAKATLPGRAVATPLGAVWVDHRTYGLDYAHGFYPLAEGLLPGRDVLELLQVPELGERLAFIDTETTGLAGGAGTLAFLIGVGILECAAPAEATEAGAPGRFSLHLIFMRDPEEEPAALYYLEKLLGTATGLVTFNGQGFDLPILEARFVVNRMAPRWRALPHLDLLAVARALWREHLPSRRLGALEQDVLGIIRSEEDIASALIPYLYRQYLETGDAAEMERVLYHNAIDVLSMVSLLAHVTRLVGQPDVCCPASAEWIGLARIYERAGRQSEALTARQRALSGVAGPLDAAVASRLWAELGARARQRGAWDEALALWQAWAAACPDAVEPWVELAKHAEWMVHDPGLALAQTDAALARAAELPDRFERALVTDGLRHRRERLLRKIGRSSGAAADGQDA